MERKSNCQEDAALKLSRGFIIPLLTKKISRKQLLKKVTRFKTINLIRRVFSSQCQVQVRRVQACRIQVYRINKMISLSSLQKMATTLPKQIMKVRSLCCTTISCLRNTRVMRSRRFSMSSQRRKRRLRASLLESSRPRASSVTFVGSYASTKPLTSSSSS